MAGCVSNRSVRPASAQCWRLLPRWVTSCVLGSFLILGFSGPPLLAADEHRVQIDVAIPKDEFFDQATPRLNDALQGSAQINTLDVASASEAIQRVQKGEIDVAIVPVAVLADFIPGFGIYDLPFSFTDKKPNAFFTGWQLKPELSSQLNAKGLSALGGVWYGGTRVIASQLPRRSPNDFEGSTVAYSTNSYKSIDLSNVGAKTVKMADGEIDSKLKLGQIDAAEVTWDEASKLKPPFVTQSNHRFDGLVAIYKDDKFTALTPQEQTNISQAISDTESYVTANVTARETRAKNVIRYSRDTASLNIDEAMRAQWRIALNKGQEKTISSIGPQLVREAKAKAQSSEDLKRASLSWNAWFESDGDVASTLALETPYDFVLDLGRGDYPSALADAISKQLQEKIDDSKGDIQLLIKPVLMGGLLEPLEGSDFTAARMIISRKRLVPDAGDTGYRQQVQNKQITLSAMAEKLSVSKPLRWSLMARSTGCARVVVSIWDVAGVKPLDYLVVSVPVTAKGEASSESCGAGVFGGQLVAGLSGLLELGDAHAGNAPADSALHLFEADSSVGNPRTVAVYVDRKEFEAAEKNGSNPPVYAWELKGNLSLFLGQQSMLPGSIIEARDRIGEPQPYADVVTRMTNALFIGRSDRDKEEAGKAKKAMQQLSAQASSPIVLVRYFDKVGRIQYLPLAMLGANAPNALFSHRVTVVQPLQDAQKAAPDACVNSWDFAIPTDLDGASPEMLKLLSQEDWRIQGSNLNWYQDNTALVKYISPPGGAAQTTSNALVLLAHHGEGDITFSSKGLPSRVLDTDVNRRFMPGSVAVLAACSTVGASTASRQFVKLLVDNGMSAIVASPFQVNTDFGVRLAVSFVTVAQDLRTTGEPARFVDVFNRALQKTIDAYGEESGYADMALEFQIIGNHELRMCAGPSYSQQGVQ
ncbi:TRAP transporter substrate-binding protein [Pseudomonas sp. MDT2-39-1]